MHVICCTAGPAREILVLIGYMYTQKLPMNAHTGVISALGWRSYLWSESFFIHNLCMREAKALTRLRKCAGSFEPPLLADAISAKITWDCPNMDTQRQKLSTTFFLAHFFRARLSDANKPNK